MPEAHIVEDNRPMKRYKATITIEMVFDHDPIDGDEAVDQNFIEYLTVEGDDEDTTFFIDGYPKTVACTWEEINA